MYINIDTIASHIYVQNQIIRKKIFLFFIVIYNHSLNRASKKQTFHSPTNDSIYQTFQMHLIYLNLLQIFAP